MGEKSRSRRGSTDKRSKKRDRETKRSVPKKKRKTEDKKKGDDLTTKKVKEMAQELLKKRDNVNPALLKEQGKASFVKPVFMSRRARQNQMRTKKKESKEKMSKMKKQEQKARDEFFRSARYDRR